MILAELLLKRIIDDLPSNRNWLDPDVEKQARQLLKEVNLQPAVVETVTADWKDIEGLAESFKQALKSFGISVIDHPNCEGSDQYGFLLSNRPLTEDEIKAQRFDAEEDNDS